MSPQRLSGVCRALYVFDVGRGIDLQRSETCLSESRSPVFQHKSRLPQGELAAPSKISWNSVELPCGQHATAAEVEVSIYSQGALCITWSIPFDSTLGELAVLSAHLYDRKEFIQRSRQLASEVSQAIASAIDRPCTSEHVEDYVIFQAQSVENSAELLESMRTELGQLLRAEHGGLAAQEIEDATSNPVSYKRGDLCLVDWLAAFLMGENTEDERLVLEFATVELVLLRNLDAHLDLGIRRAYALLSKPRGMLVRLLGRSNEIEHIGRMQADDALLHEGIDNSLKLFGDDYLARLYRTASNRFHFNDWDRSIQRKLGVLRSIHQSLSDVAAHRRAEVLEWIIILLIAADILVYLR